MEWGTDGLTIAHTPIPCAWFDFGNAEDVRRCWNLNNVSVQHFNDNSAQMDTLTTQTLAQIDPQLLPTRWHGQVPTRDQLDRERNAWH